MSDAAPASTSRGPDVEARARAVLEPAAHLHRHGHDDRLGDRVDDRGSARSGSSSSVAPAPVFVTFRTGQPKLMSTMSAPAASTIRAASAITRRLGAEDLHGERLLVGRDAQVAERALVPVVEPGAAHHLRADEPRAEAPPLAAKGLHADARHRREHEARGDLDRRRIAQELAKIYLHRARNRNRGAIDDRPRASLQSPPATAPVRRAFFFGRRPAVKEVILTPEGYEKLKQEIEYLSNDKRREVAERIRIAREFGDIAENAEYDDAKNEQAMLEHRIATLEERLRDARVITQEGRRQGRRLDRLEGQAAGRRRQARRSSTTSSARPRRIRRRTSSPTSRRSARRSSATRRARRSRSRLPAAR